MLHAARCRVPVETEIILDRRLREGDDASAWKAKDGRLSYSYTTRVRCTAASHMRIARSRGISREGSGHALATLRVRIQCVCVHVHVRALRVRVRVRACVCVRVLRVRACANQGLLRLRGAGAAG